MKKYEMLPTENNLIETLQNNLINRNKDIFYFYNILQAQETSNTIVIDGKWGSGKTFFIRQTKMLIDALNPLSKMREEVKEKVINSIYLPKEEESKNYILTIYYDAWKNDNDTDPIISLIYEITKQLSIDFTLSDDSFFKIAEAIIETISGRNINGIINAFKSEDGFTKLKGQKKIEEKMSDFFTELLQERGNRLVIFIDELDRCKPTFAVHLLEQIKHYILDDRITIVLSINIEQLQFTIKHFYGIDFDSCRYLDRFFDIRITMPPANMEKFYGQIGLESGYLVDKVIRRVIKMYNFELREIMRFYSQVKAATYKVTHDRQGCKYMFENKKDLSFIMIYIIPLLIGLKITNSTKYNRFINGEDDTPMKELFDVDEDMYILKKMLNNNESFDIEVGKDIITVDEMIERLYKAIFDNTNSRNTYNIKFGEYEFTMESKEFAIRISSIMSDFAELS